MEKMIAEMDLPIETKIFSLDYAKAEDIKTKISEVLTKGVGMIQVDERTNKVVITDLAKKIPEITSIITEMDERHKEVLIEAKIVQIELNEQYQHGIDWKALFNKYSDKGVRFSFDNVTSTGNLFTSGATGGALTIANMTSNYIDAVLEILETVGKTNVISCPRITVLNNEEAKVLVGTNQPYVTTTTTIPEGGQQIESQNVTYIDIGISLTVTPTINRDGYVTMKIKPEVSSLADSLTVDGNEFPVVSTSETETTVMVKDGHTIVIAGLIEDRDVLIENKIPILGDIPIIGNLFKSRTVGSAGETDLPEKKELVAFLTPYIVYGTETFPEAENVWLEDKFIQRELLEQQMSLAVEDLMKKRSLVREIPPPIEKKDKKTRISEDLIWFEKKEKEKSKEIKKAELPKVPKEEKIPVKEAKSVKKTEEVKKSPEEAAGHIIEKAPEEAKIVIPPAYLIPPTPGYYTYFENIRNRIFWVAQNTYPRDYKGEKEDVKVIFTLARNGELKGEPKVLDDVNKKLAKAEIDAVKKAAPFPAFPKRLDKDEEIFRIVITYR
jgi:hypothetical protein